MSDCRYVALQEKTQELLQGSLKHVRVAALAAALVPLASITVSAAVDTAQCSSGGCPPSCTIPATSEISTQSCVESLLIGPLDSWMSRVMLRCAHDVSKWAGLVGYYTSSEFPRM
jgi:hypothetical protein